MKGSLRKYRFLCVALFLLFVNLGGWAVASDEVTIGVPKFGEDLNVIRSGEVAARILRGSLTTGLIRTVGKKEKGAGIGFGLADSLVVNDSGQEWGFRLRTGVSFRNGRPVLPSDVIWSLNRCIEGGGLPSISGARLGIAVEVGVQRDWIYLSFRSPRLILEGSEAANEVSNCPVLEADSGTIFGPAFGQGGNFVSFGEFALSTLRLGKEYEIVRVGSKDPFKHGASKVILRGIAEPDLGLTALRVGTVDAFFVEDSKVLELAQKDETLRVVDCSTYSVIVRVGFKLDCSPSLRMLEVGYVG
jgi:ABC-type transport system substrate-binding protein